jgi:cell division protein FtsN
MAWATTPLELVREGRFREAQAMVDSLGRNSQYALILDAIQEPNAARACSLYQVVTMLFPETDVDTFARNRLQAASDMGFKPVEEKQLIAVSETIEPESSAQSESPEVVQLAPPKQRAEPVADQKAEPSPPLSSPTPVAVAPIMTSDKTVQPVKKEELTPERQRVTPLPETLQPHDKPIASSGRWFIQVGAFGNHSNADRLAARLREAGYSVILVPKENAVTTFMQVRVGGYATKEDCTPVAEELKRKFEVPTVIVAQ